MAVLCPCDRKKVTADLLQARYEFHEPRRPKQSLAGFGIGPLPVNVRHEKRRTFDPIHRLD